MRCTSLETFCKPLRWLTCVSYHEHPFVVLLFDNWGGFLLRFA